MQYILCKSGFVLAISVASLSIHLYVCTVQEEFMKLKTRKLIPPLEYALSYGVERRKKDIPTHKHTIYLTLGI